MKRLVLLGALGFGLSGLGSGQNNQGQDNNNQGHNVVTMPEGTVVELPLFLGGLGLWFWSRHRSATKLGSQTPDQWSDKYARNRIPCAPPLILRGFPTKPVVLRSSPLPCSPGHWRTRAPCAAASQ